MNKLLKQLITATISCVLAACTGSTGTDNQGEGRASSSRSDCIFRASVRGYTVLDESNLIVSASGRHNYHMVLKRRAHGLKSSWAIDFDSPTGRVCAGFSEIIFDDDFGNGSIRIAQIRELSQEEHESLLIQYGKMEPEIQQAPAQREVKGAEVEELDPDATRD